MESLERCNVVLVGKNKFMDSMLLQSKVYPNDFLLWPITIQLTDKMKIGTNALHARPCFVLYVIMI